MVGPPHPPGTRLPPAHHQVALGHRLTCPPLPASNACPIEMLGQPPVYWSVLSWPQEKGKEATGGSNFIVDVTEPATSRTPSAPWAAKTLTSVHIQASTSYVRRTRAAPSVRATHVSGLNSHTWLVATVWASAGLDRLSPGCPDVPRPPGRRADSCLGGKGRAGPSEAAVVGGGRMTSAWLPCGDHGPGWVGWYRASSSAVSPGAFPNGSLTGSIRKS